MQPFTTETAGVGSYATVNGLRMYYEIHGSGFPMVLIHGGGSTIETTFGRIISSIAQSHQVIAVELQAHGHTSDRDAPESFCQDADDVIELLRQLKIAKADIFGFSNGGQTAFEIALRHPRVVRSMIIASAFYKREGAPAAFWSGFDSAQLSDMPEVYQKEFLKITADPVALQNMFDKDVKRMITFEDWNEEDIGKINIPVLIVTGDRDLTLPEHAVEMYRLLPQARLAILPGDHGSYMGEMMSLNKHSQLPNVFIAIIEDFLETSFG